MNVEIATETPIFLFLEYLFRKFGILSLQCSGPQTYQWLGKFFLDKTKVFGSREAPASFASLPETIVNFVCCIHQIPKTMFKCNWMMFLWLRAENQG
jgi:hypothetical protein